MSVNRNAPGAGGHSVHRVGDPLPSVLVLRDLRPIFGLSVKRLWHLEQLGELKQFETKGQIGNRVRYSGKKVQDWLDGNEESETPTLDVRATGTLKRARHPNHVRRPKEASAHGFTESTKTATRHA